MSTSLLFQKSFYHKILKNLHFLALKKFKVSKSTGHTLAVENLPNTPSDVMAAGAGAQPDVCIWFAFWPGIITAFSTRGFADIPLHAGGKSQKG